MPSPYLRDLSAALRSAPRLTPAPPPRTDPLNCPVCAVTMTIERIRGLSLDVCPSHGMWFDRHEVSQLEDRIRAGERLTTSQAVADARHNGKLSGMFLGMFSLFLSED